MVITVLPIVMVYPFIQRHFIKGVIIGAIKGWRRRRDGLLRPRRPPSS
ncbi:hypothetical protein [Micromonospora deserti]|nr:hypothetical protein [Micromonospora deserti]